MAACLAKGDKTNTHEKHVVLNTEALHGCLVSVFIKEAWCLPRGEAELVCKEFSVVLSLL